MTRSVAERSRGKAIRRDVIEGKFVELLEDLTPSRNLFDLARAMFRDAWDQRQEQAHALAKSHEKEVAGIDKQINSLLDRIVETTSGSVISAYEKRIEALEHGKLILAEKRENAGGKSATFEENVRTRLRLSRKPFKTLAFRAGLSFRSWCCGSHLRGIWHIAWKQGFKPRRPPYRSSY